MLPSIFLLSIVGHTALGQASFWLTNVNPNVDAPVFDAEGAPLYGNDYLVEPWGGPSSNSLSPALTYYSEPNKGECHYEKLSRSANRLDDLSYAARVQAQGNLVMNGTFDTDASSWSVNNGSSHFNGKIGNPPGSFVLTDAPSPASDPTFSQTINGLVSSTAYVVSGDYRFMFDAGGGSPTALSFGVAIDGVFLFEAANPQDAAWHSFSVFYTATAPSVDLSISAQRNGTSVDYAIDNILIHVPEPSSAGLLGLGVVAWAVLVRRRRNS